MRIIPIVPFALAAVLVVPASAQVAVPNPPRGGTYAFSWTGEESPHAVIGVTTSAGEARDTLGLRVTDVADGGPAAKAGIRVGDRIQAINGINLRIESIDIGDQQMADAMSRRLTSELGKLNPGDDVSLEVYHDGRARSLTLKTVSADSLYGAATGMFATAERASSRAVLGVSLATTGSKRDTLGIVIVGVNDSGPAAKAGLEEGDRIAGINGVDLKVDPADAGDSYVESARYQRLQKAMDKVSPGDEVTLQVWADGRFKTVRLKTVRASELAENGNVFLFRDNGAGPMMQLDINRAQIDARVQRAMQQARQAMDQARQNIQRIQIERLNPTVRWLDDSAAPAPMPDLAPVPAPALAPMAPALVPPAPLAPVLPVRVIRMIEF